MKVKLRVTKGHHAGKVIDVNRARYLIGRHQECHLQVTSSKVSVHHSAILVRKDSAWVHDLGSTNGTFINDERIPEAEDRQLKNGDELRLGPLVCEVQFEPGVTEPEKPTRNFSDSDAANFLLKDPPERLVGIEGDSDYDSTVLNYPVDMPEASQKKKGK